MGLALTKAGDFLQITREVMYYLEPLELCDSETFYHSSRVANSCSVLAQEFGLSEYDRYILYISGLLHDIGKLKVPLEVIRKNAPLTNDERKIMDLHPRYGFELLKDLSPDLQLVRRIIVAHHESNGRSYPRSSKSNGWTGIEKRVRDEYAERYAKVLAVADMYDSLKHPRHYANGQTKEPIADILLNQFHGPPEYTSVILEINPN